jgi:sugar-specific transcriptional regulator TrmB
MTKNSDSEVERALLTLGFLEREAQVYNACLVHGELTILEIARITSIKRTTLYGVLEQLTTKGMLRFFQKAAHRVYVAQDPAHIRKELELQFDQAKGRLAVYDEVSSILNTPYQYADGKPAVTVYRGQREIRRIGEQIISEAPKEICCVSTPDIFEHVLGADYVHDHIVPKRIEAKIAMRTVYVNDKINHENYLDNKELLRNVRIAPQQFSNPTYTAVYGNTVFILTSAVEAYGILIRSNDYAATMQNWFEVLWEASRPLGE